MALFSLSLEQLYSGFRTVARCRRDEWKKHVVEDLADVLEPIHTLLEMGMAIVETFRVTASLIDAEGNSISDCEAVLGGTYSTGIAIRWRTIRAWRKGMVIAERIGELPPEGAMSESNRLT